MRFGSHSANSVLKSQVPAVVKTNANFLFFMRINSMPKCKKFLLVTSQSPHLRSEIQKQTIIIYVILIIVSYVEISENGHRHLHTDNALFGHGTENALLFWAHRRGRYPWSCSFMFIPLLEVREAHRSENVDPF